MHSRITNCYNSYLEHRTSLRFSTLNSSFNASFYFYFFHPEATLVQNNIDGFLISER